MTTPRPSILLLASVAALTAAALTAAGCASQPTDHPAAVASSATPARPTPTSGDPDPEAAAAVPTDCLNPDNQQPQLDACQARLTADLPPDLLDTHGRVPDPYELNITGRVLCVRARDRITEGMSALTVAADAENTLAIDPNAPVGATWVVRYLGAVFVDLCPDVGAYLSAAHTP